MNWTPWRPQATERPNVLNLTPGSANVRGAERIFPQEAPDPSLQGGAYGLIPCRPSMRQVVTFFHDQNVAMGEKSFVATIVGPNPRAAYPRGQMSPFSARANIQVPPHVAYGSLFVDQSTPYGFG